MAQVYKLNMNPIDLSSSDIRNKIAEDVYVNGLNENVYNIPDSVFEYIINRGLYQDA